MKRTPQKGIFFNQRIHNALLGLQEQLQKKEGKRFSQAKFAKVFDVDGQTPTRWIWGHQRMSAEHLIQAANEANTPLFWEFLEFAGITRSLIWDKVREEIQKEIKDPKAREVIRKHIIPLMQRKMSK